MRCRLTLLLSGLALVATAAPPVYAARVIVRVAPPIPRADVVPIRPVAGYVWRPGYWSWNGARYVWLPGVYVAPPRPRAAWVPGRWVAERRGWVWVDGHWR